MSPSRTLDGPVLVLGSDAATLAAELANRIPAQVTWARSASEAAGIPASAVIIVGPSPELDLLELFERPFLSGTPLIICCPSKRVRWTRYSDVIVVPEPDDIASRCALILHGLAQRDDCPAA